jgi:hypothetical protein
MIQIQNAKVYNGKLQTRHEKKAAQMSNSKVKAKLIFYFGFKGVIHYFFCQNKESNKHST